MVQDFNNGDERALLVGEDQLVLEPSLGVLHLR